MPLPPVIANMLIVPFVLRYAYGVALPIPFMMLTVGIGEVISCGVLGFVLYSALKKIQKQHLPDRRLSGITRVGTGGNANGDVHFLQKCTSPFALSDICAAAACSHLIHLCIADAAALPAAYVYIDHACICISPPGLPHSVHPALRLPAGPD